MSTAVENRMAELNIRLPKVGAAIANYVPTVHAGPFLFVSGQLCLDEDGQLAAKGKLGKEFTIEQGQAAARLCALNVLAQVKAALGSLEQISRVVRLGGFINAQPHFTCVSAVLNGASDLMIDLFGDAGRHTRAAVGVASLPLDAAVEVEALFEVAD